MKPKIGINTLTLDSNDWYKELKDTGYNIIEINAPTVSFQFRPGWIEKIKPRLEGFDLSLHTASHLIFSKNKQFTKTNLEILKSEILASEMLGIKQLIFHLKHEKLNNQEEKIIREIVNLAKQHNVEPLYESNNLGSADVALDFLERFPDVNYNLDLGHIHHSYCKGILGCEIDEFLKKVKNRTVHIHAHNNDGTKDQHRALRDGTLDWKHVLDQLDMTKLKKIIMELKTKDDINKTKEDLEKYLNQ